MKTNTLLMLAAGAAVLYLVTRPRTAVAAGARPSTTSPTPGTTSLSQIEGAAANAGASVIGAIGNKAGDWIGGLFAERPPVTANASTSGFDEGLGLYNF